MPRPAATLAPLQVTATLMSSAADMTELRVAVRWWDTALEQFGGVPLDMTNHEDQVYAVIDGEWHAVQDDKQCMQRSKHVACTP